MTALQYMGEDILRALGQDDETSRLAGRYLIGLGWCLVPGWWFIMAGAIAGGIAGGLIDEP